VTILSGIGATHPKLLKNIQLDETWNNSCNPHA